MRSKNMCFVIWKCVWKYVWMKMYVKIRVMLFKNWKLLFEMVYQTPPHILPKKIRKFLNKNIYIYIYIYNVVKNLKIYILKGVKRTLLSNSLFSFLSRLLSVIPLSWISDQKLIPMKEMTSDWPWILRLVWFGLL